MGEHFRRKKWDEIRQVPNATTFLKTGSYDLGCEELAFTMCRLEPGTSVGHHDHKEGAEAGAEEVYFLMDGKSQVKVNDETYDAEAIEIFYFTPETMRSVYNNTDKPATWIFLAPGREAFKKGYSKVEEQ